MTHLPLPQAEEHLRDITQQFAHKKTYRLFLPSYKLVRDGNGVVSWERNAGCPYAQLGSELITH